MNLVVGNASRPVILDVATYEDSIMEAPIKSAIAIVERVISDGEKYREQEKTRLKAKRYDEDNTAEFDTDWSFKVKNNIIAFLGDRGSGKTSCMLSVKNIFLDSNPKSGKLMSMDVIDPSFFDASHNILELFVAELYNKFCEKSKKDIKNKEAILKLNRDFLTLQNNLKYLDKKKGVDYLVDDDAVELEILASGVELQTNLRKVVKRALKYFGKEFLVVAIDDLDLNPNRAYEMMEQIRKYLFMPELVILLSAKIDQLKRSVELSLNETYKVIQGDMKSQIPEMAERYITKFIPQSHRVYMISPEIFMSSELCLLTEEGKVIREFQSVAGGVLDMIFQKSRYLFYNIAGSFSYVIPRNLRNLTMLIELLVEMPDFDDSVAISTDDSPEAKQNLENKRRFKNYFYSDLLNNLYEEITIEEEKEIEELKKIISETDPSLFNKNVLDILRNKYSFTLNIYSGNNPLEDIFSEDVIPYNISIGDILEVIEYISDRVYLEKDRNFLFYIRALYSIRLYEYYDMMTDRWNQEIPEFDDDFNVIPPKNVKPKWLEDMPLLSDKIFLGIPDYFKLVGGNFISFNRKSTALLQSQRDLVLLNGKRIREIISDLCDEYDEWLKKNEEKEDKDRAPLKDEFIHKLRLIEFLVLCSAFHADVKSTRDLNEMRKVYRTLPTPYYLKRLTSVQNIVFDITRPLITGVFPSYAYRNYGDDFFKMCVNTLKYSQHSLFADLLILNQRYGSDKRISVFSDLASRIAIRNMEILTDLYGQLKSRTSSIRLHGDSDGVVGMYRELLNFIAKSYLVKTYSLSENNNEYHTVTFRPLENLVDVLKKVSKSEDLKKLFKSCFLTEEKESLDDKKPKPKLNTPEYKIFTPGFYYTTDRIRRIIFSTYPKLKKEYDGQGLIYNRLRDPELKSMVADDLIKYLASISDEEHEFSNTMTEDLQKLYLYTIAKIKEQK